MRERYDIFISHASEDKDAIVRPLALALAAAGLEVWYDEFSLKLGDSLRHSIDDGLRSAKYGVVVLSKAFFGKQWPQWELDGLLQKHLEARSILPVWYGITGADVKAYSLSLANVRAVSAADGLALVIQEILSVVKPRQSGRAGRQSIASVTIFDNDGSQVRLAEHGGARIAGCYVELAHALNARSAALVNSALRANPEMIFNLAPRFTRALVTNFRLTDNIRFDALLLHYGQWLGTTLLRFASVEDPPFDDSGQWSLTVINAIGIVAAAQHWISANREVFVNLMALPAF